MLRSSAIMFIALTLGLCSSAWSQSEEPLRRYFQLLPSEKQVSSERNPQLQDLIDETYGQLLFTEFGELIVRNILDCSPQLLIKHLGTSQNTSLKLVNELCFGPKKTTNHRWIYTLPEQNGPDKIVSLRQKNRRTYTLTLEKHNDIGLDSWTDFRSQTTTIYFPEQSDLDYLRYKLLFILAHETAIYFDQKSQLNNFLWTQHPEFQTLLAKRPQEQDQASLANFLVSANNPLISQVLSFVRAFQVEVTWLRQLPVSAWGRYIRTSHRDLEQIDYQFASSRCRQNCMAQFVQQVTEQLLPYSLPLLANSRYWSMKLTQMGSQPPSDENKDIRKVLIDFKNYYVSYAPEFQPGLKVTRENPELRAVADETARVFRDILIPQDLQTILSTSLVKPPANPVNSLVFLTTPSIGNFGVELASGPRPRIRTGSSFHIDLKDMSTYISDADMLDEFLFNYDLMVNFLKIHIDDPVSFDYEPTGTKDETPKKRPYDVNLTGGGITMNSPQTKAQLIIDQINNRQLTEATEGIQLWESKGHLSEEESIRIEHLKGMVAIHRGDLEEAVVILQAAISTYGEQLILCMDLACAHYQLSHWSEWRRNYKILQHHLQQYDSRLELKLQIDALNLLGKFFEEEGDIAKARVNYQQAMELIPSHQTPLIFKTKTQLVRLEATFGDKDIVGALYSELIQIQQSEKNLDFEIELEHALMLSEMNLVGPMHASERLLKVLSMPNILEADKSLLLFDYLEECIINKHQIPELVLEKTGQVDPYDEFEAMILNLVKNKQSEMSLNQIMTLASQVSPSCYLRLLTLALRALPQYSSEIKNKLHLLLSAIENQSRHLWNKRIDIYTESSSKLLKFDLEKRRISFESKDIDLSRKRGMLIFAEMIAQKREMTVEDMIDKIWQAEYTPDHFHRLRMTAHRMNQLLFDLTSVEKPIEVSADRIKLSPKIQFQCSGIH